MKITSIIAGAAVLFAIGSPILASAKDMPSIVVGPYVGTTGIGGSLGVQLPNDFTFRLQSGSGAIGFNGNASGIPYQGAYHAVDASALLDYNFRNSPFKLTTGLVLDDNHVDFNSNQGSYKINGMTYSSAQVGSVNGNATWRRLSPYFGTGLDTTPRSHSGFGFVMDAGAFYQGSPNVTLVTSKTPTDPFFKANLESARQDFASRVNRLHVYPVVSVGTSYRF